MNAHATLSSRGQIVIPKDIREALRLRNGDRLRFRRVGRMIVMEADKDDDKAISYDDYKLRFPAYDGPPVSLEDMEKAITKLASDWKR